jgi:2-phospho-L-lactate guanylyltransferase
MTERIYCVLPVRGLTDGKSRLGSILDDASRARLNVWLLDRTLDVLEEYPGAALILVVSASSEVRARALRRGISAVPDPPNGGLNEAVAEGVSVARARGGSGAFIIPVDLPLLSAKALRRLVVEATPPPICLMASDRRGEGTNFLFQSPILLRSFGYGIGSFRRHRRLATAAGLGVVASHEPTLAFDLDLPDDLQLWRQMCGEAASVQNSPAQFPSF